MTVYVDDLMTCVPTPRWLHRSSCHLMADSEEELSAFADRMGLRREWKQGGSVPHYDLTPNKRKQAVQQGAVEVDMPMMIERLRRLRGGGRG